MVVAPGPLTLTVDLEVFTPNAGAGRGHGEIRLENKTPEGGGVK